MGGIIINKEKLLYMPNIKGDLAAEKITFDHCNQKSCVIHSTLVMAQNTIREMYKDIRRLQRQVDRKDKSIQRMFTQLEERAEMIKNLITITKEDHQLILTINNKQNLIAP